MLHVSPGSWLGANITHHQTTTKSSHVLQPPYLIANERNDFLRYASPNEQSVITREQLGFYHALVVAGTYKLPKGFDGLSATSFYSALTSCINEHSYLSVTVENMDTDKAYFRRVPTINLNNKISFQEGLQSDFSVTDLEQIFASEVDKPFSDNEPPWRVKICPLQHACIIALSFSHTLGDGMFGKAFHRTFLHALNSKKTHSELELSTVEIPPKPLPAPFDTPERLPISWSYLISSSVAYLVPSLLGRRASASTLDAGTWLGAPISVTPTHMRLRKVPASILAKSLKATRMHDAKLTGLFQHLIVRALSELLPVDSSYTNFVSATAVNMRKSIGTSDDQGGLFTSGCVITHPRQDPSLASSTLTIDDWSAITSATQSLAESWSTTQDQFIGLLKYLPSIRKWLSSKEGTQRSCSFQVSNIGAFEAFKDEPGEDESTAKIEDVLFATPGEVIGGPLKFTLISLKGGDLNYVVSWRSGALDIGELDESNFVEAVCSSIEDDLASL